MKLGRRAFLKTGLASPFVVLGPGCGNDVEPAPVVDVEVGDVFSDEATYGKIRVPLAIHPALSQVGGAVTLRHQQLPAGDFYFQRPTGGVLLVRRAPDGDPQPFIATGSP